MILRQEGGYKGAYEIDWACYMEIAARAMSDMSAIFGTNLVHHLQAGNQDHHVAYQRFVGLRTGQGSLPSSPFSAAGTKRLITRICSRLGFDVRFVSSALKDYGLPEAFVSWIWVRPKEKLLTILYNGQKIQMAPGRHKTLEKTLLHECAHGVLHHEVIAGKLAQNPLKLLPGLDASHEQKAWLYAMIVWGVLVGDHARWIHENGSADENGSTDAAWMLS